LLPKSLRRFENIATVAGANADQANFSPRIAVENLADRLPHHLQTGLEVFVFVVHSMPCRPKSLFTMITGAKTTRSTPGFQCRREQVRQARQAGGFHSGARNPSNRIKYFRCISLRQARRECEELLLIKFIHFRNWFVIARVDNRAMLKQASGIANVPLVAAGRLTFSPS